MKLLYVTACLTVESLEPVATLLAEFKKLEEETLKEPGCQYFHAHLLNEKEMMLWEIWDDEQALTQHHGMPHTKACAAKKLTSVKWLLKSEKS